ncbi:tetratricopeptide repeat protein [Fulvivirga maritima]|uniref:tetratricopeptide repeat protein n=1 Tax=Fulvivirga maritima TaxID=2904247 RepID=UPI001F3CCEE2|nr:tetratricopeptide repeat protein [Fulvivirga maritima]UII28441.1 tetratricopeptide repeat protein [Fulvivirga maritima]
MLKTRIILIISAAVLVAIIFTLPKVVVDNDDKAVPNETPAGSSHAEPTPTEIETGDTPHGQAVPEDVQKKIDNLKIDYANSSNIEKSVIFADSLAELYLSINKYDSAAKFVEIIAENIPNEENWERAGSTYYDAFGFAMEPQKRAYLGEKAQEYFLKVMENTPSNLDVKNKLAMTYLSTKPMKGVGMLKEIIEQDPKNEKAMFNLGVLSMQSNQYAKAVEHFSKLVEVYPKNTQAQFFLGVSYLETGNKEKAKEQFELVKTLDDDPEVQATVDSYLEDIR